jgi:SAM-dependent methyltransferase
MAEDFCKSRFDAIDICNLLPTGACSYGTNLITKNAIVDDFMEREQETSNFRFTVHNVLEGPIPFESNTFDYVEQSITTLAYKAHDWPKVLQELKRVTKPGGYIQLIEPELYLRQVGPNGEQWQEHGKIDYIICGKSLTDCSSSSS